MVVEQSRIKKGVFLTGGPVGCDGQFIGKRAAPLPPDLAEFDIKLPV